MTLSLRERQEGYESNYDFKILNRLPVIIRSTIRNYKRLTQQLSQPFNNDLSDIMSQTMLYTITNIPDAIFGYQHNDEINFILRNDQDESSPWHNNNIQKISSTVSSLTTLGFVRSENIFAEDIDLVGEAVFNTKVFAAPQIIEAFNNMVFRQALCMKNAVNNASFYELSEKLGKGPTLSLLKDKDFSEKTDILLQHCGTNIIDDYPLHFLRGIGIYKVPVIINTRDGTARRNRWHIDKELPNFVEDKDFLLNILNNGLDIYRGPDTLFED